MAGGITFISSGLGKSGSGICSKDKSPKGVDIVSGITSALCARVTIGPPVIGEPIDSPSDTVGFKLRPSSFAICSIKPRLAIG